MPSHHRGQPTISFRASTYQRSIIEQRAFLSGMYKKDFIIRCCIYSNIVVVGKKENIQRIVDALQEMQMVMKEIVGQIQSGNFALTDESYEELKDDYLALAITIVDIVNGAAYLFEKESVINNQHWKAELELEQYRHVLKLEEDSKEN